MRSVMNTITPRLSIVKYAEFLMQDQPMDPEVVRLNGKPPEEVARRGPREAYAMITYCVLEGSVCVGKEPVEVTSTRFSISARMFIGASEYGLASVLSMDEAFYRRYMANGTCSKAVLTRTGELMPYYPERGERIIRLQTRKR